MEDSKPKFVVVELDNGKYQVRQRCLCGWLWWKRECLKPFLYVLVQKELHSYFLDVEEIRKNQFRNKADAKLAKRLCAEFRNDGKAELKRVVKDD